jgi:uncharacterized membrane protein YfcA
MPSFEAIVVASLIVVFAYGVFAITGFGSTLIAVPLLAHIFPLKFVIPMVVALDCVGSLRMGLKLRANVHKKEFLPLLPFMAAGMVAGVFLLVGLSPSLLLGALGILVMLFGASYAVKRGLPLVLPRWSAAPIGLAGGLASSAFGVGGPLYVFFLTARGATPDQIRATMPVVFIFTSIARIVLFAAAGLFTPDVLVASALLLPVMMLGLYLGNRLHLNLPREQIIRFIGGLLVLSGLSLILRALN